MTFSDTMTKPQVSGSAGTPRPVFGRSASERAMLYRWLGHVFQRECDHGVLTWHRSRQGLEFLSALASHTPFAAGVERLREAICSTEPPDDVVLRLAGNFSALFHGVDPSRAAPPYESHYREEDGRLFGEATVRMQQVLSRHGLILMGFSEPADHIAVHLQMMAYLADLMSGHDPGNSDAELASSQAELLTDHLGGWVDEFGSDCIRFDRSGFYAGAAEIMLAFLAEERRSLPARKRA